MTAEVEQRDLTVDEARAFVRHVRASVEEIGAWIVRAVTGRAWLALGYPSWDAMCEAEFDGAVVRLPREDRREAVASLREAGLSTRAIAGALGVNAETVRRDSTAANAAVPGRVTSLDGRDRPATQPTKTVRIVDTRTGELSEETYLAPEHITAAPVPTGAQILDAIEKRRPGAKARVEEGHIRARWSKAMAGAPDIELMVEQYGTEALAAALDPTFLSVSTSVLRDAHRAAARIKDLHTPGLRVVDGSST